MEPQKPHSIAVILFDGVMALDVTGPTDTLAAANYFWRKSHGFTGEETFYDFQFIGVEKTTVTALSGLKLAAEQTIQNIAPSTFDAILVPGGNGVFKASKNRDLINWIAAAHSINKRTVSVCTGSHLLAEAGILDGHACCTHWTLSRELAKQYPNLTVDPESLYLADGKIITSAGVTSGIDMTLALVEADMGRDAALNVARHLVVHLKRPGNQSQFSWPLKAQTAGGSEPISRAVRWVLENINDPIPVERLAEQSGMSLRSFSRHFRNKIGDTPAKFVAQARLENARLLLEENPDITLANAATASGFSSPEHLSRAFERRFGIHPTSYRKTFKLS